MTENHNHGDEWAPSRLILQAEVGSGAHGMALAGKDDTDLMGVYLEGPEHLLGLAGYAGHLTRRTKPIGVRSEHNDVDETYYSLRKYVDLACKGNPSITMLLFLEQESYKILQTAGIFLLQQREAIVSKHTVYRFRGYLKEQKMRFIGSTPELRRAALKEAGLTDISVAYPEPEPRFIADAVFPKLNRVPKRPELVEAFGYDTKYASHAYRLGCQGYELHQTGRLRYPMSAPVLEDAMRIKRGEVSAEVALEMITEVEGALDDRIEKSSTPLRERPDYGRVNEMLEAIYTTEWGHEIARPPFDQRPRELQKEETDA